MNDDRQRKIRSFLAINLPQDIKQQIGRTISELKSENTSSVFRWVGEDNLHLTLHFFGDLSEDQINSLKSPLEKLFADFPSLSLRSGGLGCLPSKQEPHVLYLSLEDTHKLFTLVSDLRRMLSDLGYEIDVRQFQSHLTLARIKGRAQCNMGQARVPQFSFPVKSIELMASKLTPQGSMYSPLWTFPLSF